MHVDALCGLVSRPAGRVTIPAGYARDVGPGVYDIHSPVVPTVEWIAGKLRSFVEASWVVWLNAESSAQPHGQRRCAPTQHCC